MKALLRPALTLFAILTVLTGVVYPLAVTGISQLLFPHEANGSIVTVKGKPVGSALIGQQFTSPGNFWGRPSATGPYPNNAAVSSGSNLGPLNPALTDAVKARIEALTRRRPGKRPAGADRSGDRIGKRPRSGHFARGGLLSGDARGQDPALTGRRGKDVDRATRRAAVVGYLRRAARECARSSTSHSKPCDDRRNRDALPSYLFLIRCQSGRRVTMRLTIEADMEGN